jgi:glycosyltransferase involved in cell wall biosynthesis
METKHEHTFVASAQELEYCACGASRNVEGVIAEPKFEKDPLMSFIVPVHKVPREVMQRCLMSLVDQDYPELEIICVVNGDLADPDIQPAAQVCEEFAAKYPIIQIRYLSEANACIARNEGFADSKGEIISFFNSDYIAKPGMARMWAVQLREHKDCGFIYGAYEYSSAERAWYPSKPFDPFQLRIANYIDCGFPLWRKHVVPWDPECKSLQDWDFWIRVVFRCTDKHDPFCPGACSRLRAQRLVSRPGDLLYRRAAARRRSIGGFQLELDRPGSLHQSQKRDR